MSGYSITKGDDNQRQAVRDSLKDLDRLSAQLQEDVVTAWVTTWLGSANQSIADIPYSLVAPNYRLFDHINDVTRIGQALAREAEKEWGIAHDPAILLPILMLHDVDKPLIYQRNQTGAELSELGKQLPHGVIGAMLLKDLGFPHDVVATVATHAADAPFHNNNFYAYVLHYADMFATDHVMRLSGIKPFYTRK